MNKTDYVLRIVEVSTIEMLDQLEFSPGQLIIVDNGKGIYYDPTTGTTINDRQLIGSTNKGDGEGSLSTDNASANGYSSVALVEDANAISDYSVALGNNAVSGCFAFHIKAFDIANRKVYLSSDTLETPTKPVLVGANGVTEESLIEDDFPELPYAVNTYKENGELTKKGDYIAMLMYTFYYFNQTIASIDKNVITLNEDFPFTTVRTISKPTIEKYSLFVPNNPTVGAVNIGYGGVSLGYYTKASGENAVAEGYNTLAAGKRSHAEGYNTKTGIHAHAEGQGGIASGYGSHAEGYNTVASGQYTHAEGSESKAIGEYTHAEGVNTISKAQAAHAEGWHTEALGPQSHTEGTSSKTTEKAKSSHAEGSYTIASGENQHVQGKYNIEDIENTYAHIVGNGSLSKRSNAHTLDWKGNAWFAGDIFVGENNEKVATEKTIEKIVNSAPETLDTLNELSKALGDDPNFATTITNKLTKKVDKTAMGTIKAGSGSNSLQSGTGNASGSFSVAVGRTTEASGPHSFAEGWNNDATGDSSHAEGINTLASGKFTHAEGNKTQATAESAHAEGYGTIAKGQWSHAEGSNTQANGNAAHAEGDGCVANAARSHAEGQNTQARATFSHAEGLGTYIPPEAPGQHVQGKYNKQDNKGIYAHIVGNGTSEARSNAHTLDWNGNAWFAGNITLGENNDRVATLADVNNACADIYIKRI